MNAKIDKKAQQYNDPEDLSGRLDLLETAPRSPFSLDGPPDFSEFDMDGDDELTFEEESDMNPSSEDYQHVVEDLSDEGTQYLEDELNVPTDSDDILLEEEPDEVLDLDEALGDASALLPAESTPEVSSPLEEEVDMNLTEDGFVPGSDLPLGSLDEQKEDEPKSWEKDQDLKLFTRYVFNAYRSIPKHDGKTTLGCERAIKYLSNLNREISKAIAMDTKTVLDVPSLENLRVKIIKDIHMLKEHKKKLDDRIKPKTASEEIVKEASIPNFQLVITPFQRAITGMIVNSVVSAGKPFEEVYAFLKDKYKFDEREELEIFQILMDMGYQIFKDRGIIGKDKKSVDFMENYFA